MIALKEGHKIQKDIQEKKEETGKERLNPIELAQATWKHITPVVVADLAGSLLVVDGLRVEHKRAVGFATAAGIAEETLRLTREKEEETVGKSKSKDIQHEVTETEAQSFWDRHSEIFETGHGNQLFMDHLTGIVYRSDKMYLESREVEFNKMLLRRQDIPLNEWYEFIGINIKFIPAIAYAFGFSTRKDKHGRPLNPLNVTDEMLLNMYIVPVMLDNGETVGVVYYDIKPNFDPDLGSNQVWDQILTH